MKYNYDIMQQQPQYGTEERYPALRSIITLYKFLAWLIICAALIVSLAAALLFNLKQSVPFIMFSMFIGIAGFINFMAFSEGILLILDVEQNTRNIYYR